MCVCLCVCVCVCVCVFVYVCVYVCVCVFVKTQSTLQCTGSGFMLCVEILSLFFLLSRNIEGHVSTHIPVYYSVSLRGTDKVFMSKTLRLYIGQSFMHWYYYYY
jgi:hypothetical protein